MNIIKSIAKSTTKGIRNDPEVRKIVTHYPRFFGFIKRRLTRSEKYGLYLTIGVLFTLFFIWLFFGIIQDYIGTDPLIRADLRIINLVSHFRTPKLNQIMLFFTYLAKGEIITVAVIFSLIILFLIRKWSYFNSLLIFVLGGELFVWIIKNIIERPRPPLAEALVIENSYSFPSGHSFIAIAFYGLITFFLFETFKRKWLKAITLILGLILVVLIGASRIYLGAHWPSDVLASYASGLAWLSIIITVTHIKRKFHPKIIHPPHLELKTIKKITLLLMVIFITFVSLYYSSHPLKPIIRPQISKTIIQTNEIDTKLFQTLPKVSETITGAPAEPINIIVVANKDSLNNAFIKSGWYLLDGTSAGSYLKIINSFLKKESYPQAPGLPVFWDVKVNDFAFGKPAIEGIDSREHIHFWETNFITPDGQSIFVGTAHFDAQIKKSGKIILPFHSTELIVDKERDDLKNELETNGFLKSFEKINLTGLTYGTKKSGNNFLTDGQAYILYLKN